MRNVAQQFFCEKKKDEKTMNDVAPMVVADPLAAFERQGMVKVIAPAKANLYLNVQNKRADGYHEVTTIMHALSLHDVLHIDRAQEAEGGLRIDLTCWAREGIVAPALVPEENIAYKAIELLACKIGRTEHETVSVRIEKHIPCEAGLGGGSSDAAAALIGVAHLWGIDPESPEVYEAARELGADVLFFLKGGCACLTGVGDVFDHALDPMKKVVAIIKPEEGVSTCAAYAAFDENPPVIDSAAQEQALAAARAEEVLLCNNLTAAAQSLLPELAEIATWIEDQKGVEASLLSGSGSATFALCESFDDACRLVSAARARGWWSRTTTFCSLGASVTPR